MSQALSTDEKTKVMTDTAHHLIDMVQKRLNNRVEALNALATSPMDLVSDEVKKMREIEAGKIRAVMQEQKDLIDIMQLLFPKQSIALATNKKTNRKNPDKNKDA